jgi:hypothetical protein
VGPLRRVGAGAVGLGVGAAQDVEGAVDQPGVGEPGLGLVGLVGVGLVPRVPCEAGAQVEKDGGRECVLLVVAPGRVGDDGLA